MKKYMKCHKDYVPRSSRIVDKRNKKAMQQAVVLTAFHDNKLLFISETRGAWIISLKYQIAGGNLLCVVWVTGSVGQKGVLHLHFDWMIQMNLWNHFLPKISQLQTKLFIEASSRWTSQECWYRIWKSSGRQNETVTKALMSVKMANTTEIEMNQSSNFITDDLFRFGRG